MVVGFVGFSVSSVILILLYGKLGINIVIAQLISGEGGLLSNFYWHNKWTYTHQKHQDVPIATKLWQFHLSSWSGIALLTILVTFQVSALDIHYMIALAVAASLVMIWNYFWTKYYIFKGHSPELLHNPEAVIGLSLIDEHHDGHK